MPKGDIKTVNDYIASQPENAQKVLKRVRAIIRKTLPKAEEVISYKIPAYKLNGATVIYFAAWSKHYSLYPAGESVHAALGKALDGYEMSKGTIRFPLSEPVPAKLIERITKFRAKEAAEYAKKKAAPKKR